MDSETPAHNKQEQDELISYKNSRDYDLSFSAPIAVFGRYLDGAEPVDGDAEDGVNGTETDSVVERQPQVAQNVAERPVLAGQQVDRVERHRDGADEHVADGQRGDEVVGRLADRAFEDERQEDDEVAGDGDEAGRPGQQAEDDRLPQRVVARHRRHVFQTERTVKVRVGNVGHGLVGRAAGHPSCTARQLLRTRNGQCVVVVHCRHVGGKHLLGEISVT